MTSFAKIDQACRDSGIRVDFGGPQLATQWAEPDLSVIWPERPTAPEMTEAEFHKVFGPWSDWLRSAASVKNASVDYIALALLSSASAVVGNTRWAVPWDGWKEPCVIWGMLVGDPSSGKSPALDAVLDQVKEIDSELSRQYLSEREEWDAKNELASIARSQWKSDVRAALADGQTAPDKPDEANAGAAPVRPRIRITDATTESVADLLASTWRGLLLSRDELAGWLGSMDRYSGGGDRPFWLEAFGGRSFTVDRKGKPEPIIVDHLSISILGGTQPDKLDSLLVKSDDDGLTARFLTVYPEPAPIQRPTGAMDEQFAIDAFKRLHSLEPAKDEHGELRPFFIHFEDDAQHALQQFRQQCREWEKDATGLMKSHIGKLPGLSVRVSLMLALLDWSAGSEEYVSSISGQHILRACHYVGEHLRRHAYRAYGLASVPAEIRAARQIAEIIQNEKLEQISTRDIQRRRLKGIQTAREIGPAFTVLEGAGWLQMAPSEGTGRPAKLYDVNPNLWRAS